MPIRSVVVPILDPVAVYAAESNQNALLIRHLLQEAGIEAGVTEDLSLAGLWVFGTISSLHRPKVWVDRSREADAASLLREFEQRRFERSEYGASIATGSEPIEVLCERCREVSAFPAVQRGSVQACPKCKATVDVGLADEGDEWWKAGAEEAEDGT